MSHFSKWTIVYFFFPFHQIISQYLIWLWCLTNSTCHFGPCMYNQKRLYTPTHETPAILFFLFINNYNGLNLQQSITNLNWNSKICILRRKFLFQKEFHMKEFWHNKSRYKRYENAASPKEPESPQRILFICRLKLQAHTISTKGCLMQKGIPGRISTLKMK